MRAQVGLGCTAEEAAVRAQVGLAAVMMAAARAAVAMVYVTAAGTMVAAAAEGAGGDHILGFRSNMPQGKSAGGTRPDLPRDTLWVPHMFRT